VAVLGGGNQRDVAIPCKLCRACPSVKKQPRDLGVAFLDGVVEWGKAVNERCGVCTGVQELLHGRGPPVFGCPCQRRLSLTAPTESVTGSETIESGMQEASEIARGAKEAVQVVDVEGFGDGEDDLGGQLDERS